MKTKKAKKRKRGPKEERLVIKDPQKVLEPLFPLPKPKPPQKNG